VQKNKCFIFTFLVCFLTIGFINCATLQGASKDIVLYLNNKQLVSSSSPFVEKGVTLVPMRLIFEALGADVTWSFETQSIIAKKNDTTIVLTIGKTTSFVNMNKKVLLSPPQIKKGTTYVPLRFISESLGARVEWNEKDRTIFIHSSIAKPLPTLPEVKDSLLQKELSVQEVGKLENTIAFIYNNELDGSESLGSGFVISKDGTIVTNYHVIANTKKLTISFDDKKTYTDISVLGYDVLKDIAILKINTMDTFPFCNLGDSSLVVLGDSIVVIGNPMGLRNTLSTGIISSLKQQDLIQITAPISPGSSGGALFNMYGEVIGIASSGVVEGENLGFCIPINQMKNIPLAKPVTLAELHNAITVLSAPTLKSNSTAFITIVKEGSFYAFPNQKVGTYFNSFFSNPKWTYFRSSLDEDIVQFAGTCSSDDEEVTILLQFIVDDGLSSFETIYMERDGTAMLSSELDDLLDGIFNS